MLTSRIFQLEFPGSLSHVWMFWVRHELIGAWVFEQEQFLSAWVEVVQPISCTKCRNIPGAVGLMGLADEGSGVATTWCEASLVGESAFAPGRESMVLFMSSTSGMVSHLIDQGVSCDEEVMQ